MATVKRTPRHPFAGVKATLDSMRMQRWNAKGHLHLIDLDLAMVIAEKEDCDALNRKHCSGRGNVSCTRAKGFTDLQRRSFYHLRR